MPMPAAAAAAAARPASASAISAEASAICEKRSSRCAFFGVMKSSGSNSTSAATRDEKPAASKRVMARTADSPRRTPSQSPSTPLPIGVMGPMPVMATRRRPLTRALPAAGFALDDRLDRAQGPPGDVLDELRADDAVGDHVADQRPGRAKVVPDADVDVIGDAPETSRRRPCRG